MDDPIQYLRGIVLGRVEGEGECDKDRMFIDKIKGMARVNVPDDLGIRPLIWQILLQYLPSDPSSWNQTLLAKRQSYREFCNELLPWNSDITNIIQKDVKRTLSTLHFFSSGHEAGQRHQDSMTKMLSLYARLHPGTEYVQGMNEILAPIFFCFSSDPYSISVLIPQEDDSDLAETDSDVEADTFFCFDLLMAEIYERFTLGLDESDKGITSDLNHFHGLLRAVDPELWNHLDTYELHPKYFAFRWFTTLLSREFLLPDVLTLWDVLFSQRDRYQFLQECCCAMLTCIKPLLLRMNSFGELISCIQNYPPTPVEQVISNAFRIGEILSEIEQEEKISASQSFKRFFKQNRTVD